MTNKKDRKVALILHNIRSVYNVGSIFRTADTAGVSEIYLTGFTPAPKDRFGRLRKDLTKVALGAEKDISWYALETADMAINKLKDGGFYVIAIEQALHSVDYKKIKPKHKTAFILGSETDGLSENILKKCDIVAEIPMKGKKESLNVAVSAGIAVFRILSL